MKKRRIYKKQYQENIYSQLLPLINLLKQSKDFKYLGHTSIWPFYITKNRMFIPKYGIQFTFNNKLLSKLYDLRAYVDTKNDNQIHFLINYSKDIDLTRYDNIVLEKAQLVNNNIIDLNEELNYLNKTLSSVEYVQNAVEAYSAATAQGNKKIDDLYIIKQHLKEIANHYPISSIGINDINAHDNIETVPNLYVTFFFNNINQKLANKYAEEINQKYWQKNDYFYVYLQTDTHCVTYNFEYDNKEMTKSDNFDYAIKIK